MTVGTQTKNSEFIYLGTAKIYIGESETFIDETALVLSENEYPGAMGDVSLTIEKGFKTQTTFDENGVEVIKNNLLIKEVWELSLSFFEHTSANLNMALNLLKQPEEKRIELVANFPNKSNKYIGVFPKMQVVSEATVLNFLQTEKPMETPLKFRAIAYKIAPWQNNPYGTITVI